jgi:hypothetical protein
VAGVVYLLACWLGSTNLSHRPSSGLVREQEVDRGVGVVTSKLHSTHAKLMKVVNLASRIMSLTLNFVGGKSG